MGALLSLLTGLLGGDASKQRDRVAVIIVGASFSGLAALRILEKQGGGKLELTIIEPKEYFEYTPGILRALVQPKHARRITMPLRRALGSRTRWVRGRLTRVNATEVTVQDANGQEQALPYRHLILATGSGYAAPIKAPTHNPPSLAARLEALASEAQRIADAPVVCVLGGGIVGVELAAELVARYPQKPVVVVSRAKTLLPTFDARVRDAAQTWLTARGVKLCLDDELLLGADSGRGLRTKKGMSIEASLVLECTGPAPTAPAYCREAANSDGWIKVDDRLGVQGLINTEGDGAGLVLAAGDVASVRGEDKVALSAELQGEHVARRVLAVEGLRGGGDRDAPYPASLAGTSEAPFVYCISLGPHDGVLVFNDLVMRGAIGGKVAALAKAVIEQTKLWEVGRVGLWVWFWASIAHPLTFLLHKHVFRRRGP